MCSQFVMILAQLLMGCILTNIFSFFLGFYTGQRKLAQNVRADLSSSPQEPDDA